MENEIAAQKFGKFEIIEQLGQGGMGTVFKARDPQMGRIVALKTLNSDLLAHAEIRRRLAREARALSALGHPNVVALYDADVADTTPAPHIAMECVEGISLEAVITGKAAIPVARKLEIILHVCRGLQHVHEHGFVHRDLCPSNILIKQDGSAKIAGFGIVHDPQTTECRKTGIVLGVARYPSPEQLGGRVIDARSDIFCLGMVMYEFLAYRRPFDGATIVAVINQVLNEEPAPLSGVAVGIPLELENAVNKCLRKSADERFQSVGELMEKLEPIEYSLRFREVEDGWRWETLWRRLDRV